MQCMSSVQSGQPFEFLALHTQVNVNPGEHKVIEYRLVNISDEPQVVQAMPSITLESSIEKAQGAQGKQGDSNLGMWMIYVAVSVDLFSDGLLIGTGSSISLSLALILALGQVLVDGPEGYSTVANMKSKGFTRKKRMVLSLSFVLPVVVAANFSYYLLRGQSEALQIGMVTFAAGLLTVAAVEDMLSEAHESAKDTRTSLFAFIGGFVIFMLASAGL